MSYEKKLESIQQLNLINCGIAVPAAPLGRQSCLPKGAAIFYAHLLMATSKLSSAAPLVVEAAQKAEQFNLYLRLCCDRHSQTFVSRQYAAYPFRLSRTFRLDTYISNRAYLYMMNSSPGLLAGDKLRIGLQLESNAQVYLTDQAATKVHTMPIPGSIAHVSYQIDVGSGASLELVPEPLILYANAVLEQLIEVTLHPTSQLFLNEIVIPGRLARSEYYQFHYYLSRLRVLFPNGELMFGDAMRLDGQSNDFKDSVFFSKFPILANAVMVLPNVDLEKLSNKLTAVAASSSSILLGHSHLPNCNGLLIRMMGKNVSYIKTYMQYTLNLVRQLTGQPPLPEIPK